MRSSFPLATFQISSLLFDFQHFYCNVFVCEFLCVYLPWSIFLASWICRLVFFIKFEIFSATIYFNNIFSSSASTSIMHISVFNGISYFSKVLFFFFCFQLAWSLLIYLEVYGLFLLLTQICFWALLMTSSFGYFTFQLQEFNLVLVKKWFSSLNWHFLFDVL